MDAGNDSKQLEELTNCNPGGSDSPKLRTASAAQAGRTLTCWMVSAPGPKRCQTRRSRFREALRYIERAILSASPDESDGLGHYDAAVRGRRSRAQGAIQRRTDNRHSKGVKGRGGDRRAVPPHAINASELLQGRLKVFGNADQGPSRRG